MRLIQPFLFSLPMDPPAAPTLVSASPGNAQATLTWTPPSSGEFAFVEDFASGMTNWTPARQSSISITTDPGFVGELDDWIPSGGADGVIVPNDIVTYSGQLWVGTGAQNYGDSAVRCAQKFYFPGQVGTIEVDMWIPPANALAGWPHILVTQDPYTAPSSRTDNSSGPTPKVGFDIRMNTGQQVIGGVFKPRPRVFTYDDHDETEISMALGETGEGEPDNTAHVMTHIIIDFTATTIDIWADDEHWYHNEWELPVGFESGYVYLCNHNHASIKYLELTHTYTIYDNFKFTGPVYPKHFTATVPDNIVSPVTIDSGGDIDVDGATIGWVVPTSTLTTASIPSGVVEARLICTFNALGLYQVGTTRMVYSLNGNTDRQVAFEEWNGTSLDGTGMTIFSVPITLTDLVSGPNTIQFKTMVDFSGGYTPFASNVGIVYATDLSEILPDDNPILDYIIEVSLDGSTGWTVVTDAYDDTLSEVVTGLTNGTVYYYRIRAVNGGGQGSPSNILSVTPFLVTVPDTITDLNATASSGQVILTWTAPSNGGSAITDYQVQWRTTSGPGSWNTFSDGTSSSTGAIVTGLTNGTSYDFQVRAVNAIGNGSYSATDTATPSSSGVASFDSIGALVATSASTTLSVPKPSGSAAGKLLVIHAHSDNGVTPTCSGFTLLGSGTWNSWAGANTARDAVLYKIADGSEGSTFSLVYPSGTAYNEAICVCYIGSSLESFALANTTSTAGSAVSANSSLEAAFTQFADGSLNTSAPSGWTRVLNGNGTYGYYGAIRAANIGTTAATNFASNGGTGSGRGSMTYVVKP